MFPVVVFLHRPTSQQTLVDLLPIQVRTIVAVMYTLEMAGKRPGKSQRNHRTSQAPTNRSKVGTVYPVMQRDTRSLSGDDRSATLVSSPVVAAHRSYGETRRRHAATDHTSEPYMYEVGVDGPSPTEAVVDKPSSATNLAMQMMLDTRYGRVLIGRSRLSVVSSQAHSRSQHRGGRPVGSLFTNKAYRTCKKSRVDYTCRRYRAWPFPCCCSRRQALFF